MTANGNIEMPCPTSGIHELIMNCNNIKFKGSNPGNLTWFDGNDAEQARIWTENGDLKARFGELDVSKILLHSGNVSSLISSAISAFFSGADSPVKLYNWGEHHINDLDDLENGGIIIGSWDQTDTTLLNTATNPAQFGVYVTFVCKKVQQHIDEGYKFAFQIAVEHYSYSVWYRWSYSGDWYWWCKFTNGCSN